MSSVGSLRASLRAVAVGVLGLAAAASCTLDDKGAALESPVYFPSGGGNALGGLPTGATGITAGTPASGGAAFASGGAASGGTGGASSGGRALGGTATGGLGVSGGGAGGTAATSATGGSEGGSVTTGGVPSGGSGSSGAPTGGVPTGGAPTGGAPTGGAPCTDPEVWCDVDDFAGCALLGTQEHCAGCGLACPEDEECVESADADGEFECACLVGERCPAVDGVCVDTMTDLAHCGECDLACGLNAECSDGECGCTDPAYPDEHEGDCYDFATDPEHCGGFDVACLPGEECATGECVCELTLCPDEEEPEACVDLERDPDNCGVCGELCAVNGICQEGACVCQPDATLCHATEEDPGVCAYVEDDPANCGDECLDCAVEVGIDAICTAGVCECPPGHTICIDAETSSDICADRETDESHCGRCGNVCAPQGDCVQGVCIESPCQDLCDGAVTMDPAGTVKTVGCYELFAADIPNATVPRIVGWEFHDNFSIAVNGEQLPTFTNGGDYPLGDVRAGGWCVEVLSGSGNVYAPDD